jgi:hypothetical protein
MRRPLAAHALIALLLAVLATAAGTVVARADEPERMYGTQYSLTGDNYNIVVPQVSGGRTDPRREFNDSMRLAADKFIAEKDNTTTLTDLGSEVVFVGAHVVSGKISVDYMAEHGAHPYNMFVTHNTSLDSGKALAITDLFSDLSDGLYTLSEQAKLLVPGTNAGDNYYKPSIEPKAENYQNWVATKDGMQIHFGEIASHAAGNIVITVPWVKLDRDLKPEYKTIGQP